MSSVNINMVFGNRYNKAIPEKKSNFDDLCSDLNTEDKCCLGYKKQPNISQGEYQRKFSGCRESIAA